MSKLAVSDSAVNRTIVYRQVIPLTENVSLMILAAV